MPIFQLNIWICEVCGKVETELKEVDSWTDPVVVPPGYRGWEYEKEDDWGYAGEDELLACTECKETDSMEE